MSQKDAQSTSQNAKKQNAQNKQTSNCENCGHGSTK